MRWYSIPPGLQASVGEIRLILADAEGAKLLKNAQAKGPQGLVE